MTKINKTIVVTGFEPFGKNSYNPSEEIARSLHGSSTGGYRVAGYVLPVDTAIAPRHLAEIIEFEQPAALVSLGLAFGRPCLSLERVALNLKDWGEPDNAGQVKTDEPVDLNGPVAYLATLPLRQIKVSLDTAQIPSQVSNTAGLYLCNQIMYCGLHLAASSNLLMLSGFIHLPATPAMVVASGNLATPTMSLDLQLQAIRLAVETTVTAL